MNKSFIRFALGVGLSGAIIGCGMLAGSSARVAAASPDDLQGSPTLRRELARVRAATARYHLIENAMADGYVNIDVFVPGQGFHYLKPNALDATFKAEEPELLVYAANPVGNGLRLVAVEYAAPINVAPTPPEGFTGNQDVWDFNDDFDLWTLHAWVWLDNPNGMFAEFNPRVP